MTDLGPSSTAVYSGSLRRGARAAAGLICLLAGMLRIAAGTGEATPARPNVLLILIDDHGPHLHSVLNHRTPVETPNIERLAARGTWFTHAYADSPACCPSRTALLTGVHATRSGVYYNGQAYRRTSTFIAKVKTLPGAFLQAGYLTAGYGKIAHNRFLEDDIGDYTPGCYKMFNRRTDVTHTDADLLNFIIPGTRMDFWHPSWSCGVLPDEWDRNNPKMLQQDTEFANYTIRLLGESHDRPFFVACGFWRPHVSWSVPQRYYDQFPLGNIEIPRGYKPDDLDDLPMPARWLATHRDEHGLIVSHGLWKRSLQAYYASISYVDEQIGRVLSALEAGPNRGNTIIVFAADNGWHTGEKNHWSKFYLSELACQVVFSISVPGAEPRVVESPVGLIDLYPTLLSLCGLPAPDTHTLDGYNLTPLLTGRATARGAPVLSTYGRGCHSLRNDRFRYTRYRNGDEELYDHEIDPEEWTNLAKDTRYAAVKARFIPWLPVSNASEIAFASEKDRTEDVNLWEDEAFDGK